MLLVLAADLRYAAAPSETFGLAGTLWIASIALAASLCFLRLTLIMRCFQCTTPSALANVGNGASSRAVRPGVAQSSLEPEEFPRQHLSRRNHDRYRRHSELSKSNNSAVGLYHVVEREWGRYAAIAGSTIMAFSVSNVHYSRLALNNIVTQFFWATCFFFLLRALRSRRPSDWALAGLSAGLSEYFYYGTRLLPFILAMFMVFLLAVHWKHARQYAGGFLLLAGSYFVGFGPLLIHFIRNPNLYLGRGASLLIWSPHIPISFADLHRAWKTIWPVFSENLLGISTHTSQDIIFYGPLSLPAENALLVLGVALLLWHWRHPAAFLILASGLGVLLVGGTLVAYPNSMPPLINHWTPAFPAFYVALAVPVGAWITAGQSELEPRLCWILPVTVAIALLVLGCCNLHFYFHRYYADPESLKSKAYRSAQRNYEVQTAQSRYSASLGPNYKVFTVGQSSWPYDPVTTRYLVREQKWTLLTNPATELASITRDDKGVAFLFFPRKRAISANDA